MWARYWLAGPAWGIVLVLCLAGCSDEDEKSGDAGIDAEEDASVQPGDDGGPGSDPGADPGIDAGVDAGGDSGSDPGVDAGADPGIDAGHDAGGDPGTGVWRPAPGTSWQWQLTGSIDTSFDVAMYDIDLFDVPQETIDTLQSKNRIVICYFSAGSREVWRPDAGDFPRAAIGDPMDDWPDECWLDVRHPGVRDIMSARMDLAVAKGCDGVEPDNVDGYSNETGFPLSYNDQLEYNRFLAAAAHARGLSVGLKNDLEQVDDLLDDFDWALNEECFAWDECDMLSPFIQAGKAVFHVEYGNAGLADTICPQSLALDFDTLIKHMDLDAWRVSCR